jgi:methylphosphotriester-DNA--protein-cysteine methyltransferase
MLEETSMRCPVCRAENAEEATCRRCKADLSLLVTLEQSRRSAIAEAMQAAATGDGARALAFAEAAHQLRPDHLTWRWLAVAHLLLRDFARALACRERVYSSRSA